MNKNLIKVLVGTAAVVIVLLVVLVMPHTVDHACDWCGKSPSMEFKTSDGSKAYVCKDCSQECAICGERATRHYENALGMIVFVCEDCYKDAKSD